MMVGGHKHFWQIHSTWIVERQHGSLISFISMWTATDATLRISWQVEAAGLTLQNHRQQGCKINILDHNEQVPYDCKSISIRNAAQYSKEPTIWLKSSPKLCPIKSLMSDSMRYTIGTSKCHY